MIARNNILYNLNEILSLFNKSKKKRNRVLLSKLAILELCGWIEENMDKIISKYGNRKLNENPNIKYLDERIIKNTHGFHYNNHFRQMIIKLIGLINTEKIEKRINVRVMNDFTSTLITLKNLRDVCAHTSSAAITTTITSPTVMISHFYKVVNGLEEIESLLKKL